MGAVRTEILEILLALADGPCHGFGLVQAVARNTDGRIELVPSLLYRRLHRLEQEGWIEDAGEAVGLRGKPRRLYRLTPAGRKALKAEAGQVVALATSDRLRRALTHASGTAT